MDGFPILPILVLLYVIAVSGGKRKKKNRQRKKTARAASRAQKRGERPGQAAQGFEAAFEQEKEAPIPEGEDRCHPAPKRETARAAEPEPQTEPNELAQDVLRGVIMSEILTRPCERRNRRGYHG